MYQDKKNPCYAGVFKGFSALFFRVTKNSPLKPQKCRQKCRRNVAPSNPCGSKVQGTFFSRFGTGT